MQGTEKFITRTRRIVLAVCVAVLATTIGISGGTTTARGGQALQPIVRLPALEAQVLVAINTLRRERGLAPLQHNPLLAAGARAHSVSMARYGYFAHTGVDGKPFWALAGAGRRFQTVGENLAWASPTLGARETLELWLKSPAHRAILLGREWRNIGLGAVRADRAPGVFEGLDVTILTADFASLR